MFTTDSYYKIGHSHTKCDDYALSGVIDNVAYAVVSDGCTGSASEHTDVGSRLLCLIVRDTILHLSKLDFFRDPEFRANLVGDSIYSTFKNLIFRKIAEVRSLMNLSDDVFDATLLIALMIKRYNGEHDHCMFIGWGDGTLIVKYEDGVTRINTIEYSPNIPYYPSYALNHSRGKRYREAMSNGLMSYDEIIEGLSKDDPRYRQRYWCDTEEEDMFPDAGFRINAITTGPDKDRYYPVSQLIVCTDGISSFQYDPRSDEYQKNPSVFPVRNVYKDLTDYKILTGKFVERRLLRMSLVNSKKYIIHSDDLAVAAINIEQPKEKGI